MLRTHRPQPRRTPSLSRSGAAKRRSRTHATHAGSHNAGKEPHATPLRPLLASVASDWDTLSSTSMRDPRWKPAIPLCAPFWRGAIKLSSEPSSPQSPWPCAAPHHHNHARTLDLMSPYPAGGGQHHHSRTHTTPTSGPSRVLSCHLDGASSSSTHIHVIWQQSSRRLAPDPISPAHQSSMVMMVAATACAPRSSLQGAAAISARR